MTVPSKSWSLITDGQVDADSPLDTTLITALRDNLVHLEEWLGDGYAATKDHDHDGLNSKVLGTPSMQSSGYQDIAASATWTPSLGSYQFVVHNATGAASPQLYIDSAWRGWTGAGNGIREVGSFGYFDGANMRFLERTGAGTVRLWYQKFN